MERTRPWPGRMAAMPRCCGYRGAEMGNDNLQRNLDLLKSTSAHAGQYIKPVAKQVGDSCIIWVKSFNKHDREVEFLPAALEVLETPVSPASRATALLIAFSSPLRSCGPVSARSTLLRPRKAKLYQ